MVGGVAPEDEPGAQQQPERQLQLRRAVSSALMPPGGSREPAIEP
jgi:hypothetical protein